MNFRHMLKIFFGGGQIDVLEQPAVKPCIRCGKPREPKFPWCSPACCRADKAGEPRPTAAAAA